MNEEDRGEGPLFVVVEGLDGAGTTTQCRRLVDRLRNEGVAADRTREPSDGPIGSLIRQILSGRLVVRDHDGEVRSVENDVLALLFAADRLDHVDAEIEPALRAGRVVVSDRYYHSSYAYQGRRTDGGSFDIEWVRTLNDRALRPDLTIFLRAPAEVCLDRLEARGRRDRYESRDELEELERRYAEVFEALGAANQRIVELDATRSPDALHEEVHRSVAELLDAH